MSSLVILMYKIATKLPFSRVFSQSIEILLPGSCPGILDTGLDVSYVNNNIFQMLVLSNKGEVSHSPNP